MFIIHFQFLLLYTGSYSIGQSIIIGSDHSSKSDVLCHLPCRSHAVDVERRSEAEHGRQRGNEATFETSIDPYSASPRAGSGVVRLHHAHPCHSFHSKALRLG